MKIKFFINVFLILSLTACGKNGFQSPSSTSSGNSQQEEQNNQNGDSTPTNTWEKVDFEGYPTSGSSANKLVIRIDKVNQSLLLILPVPVLLPISSPMTIPDLNGAFITTAKDAEGNTALAVNIPLKLLVREGEFRPNERLPNGDLLPFVPSGELPGFSIAFPHSTTHRIHVYVGVNVAAAFVELPDFGLPIGGTFTVKNKAKTKTIGAIGYVTPKGSSHGGLYLAAQIPDELAAVIDDLIRW